MTETTKKDEILEKILEDCSENVKLGMYKHISTLIAKREAEIVAMAEGMKKENESEDFEDGGDDDYRDRRIQIQRRTVGSYNQALQDLITSINKE